MVEEVKGLHDGGLSWERIDAFGLEYRYLGLYLQGRMGFEEMSENLAIKIGQFAKRRRLGSGAWKGTGSGSIGSKEPTPTLPLP
jgi:hypothetical protein